MRKTFLMCEPSCYDIEYIINPWMTDNVHKVDKELALQQWKVFYNIISQLANIELIEQAPGLPDMTFVANAGLPFIDLNYVWLSNFAKPQRYGEARLFHGWFIANGFDVIEDPYSEGNYFEGAGDSLVDSNDEYWMGYGFRSEQKAVQRIAKFFDNKKFHMLQLTDPRFYHLDTCFCPLSKGHYLCYKSAVSGTLPPNVIEVSEEDAIRFACNSVCVDDTVIMPKCSDELIGKVAVAGYAIQTVDLSEFIKAGGAAKCLSLHIR